jgi:transcriptional regulator with XRE-family HTH domain
MNAVEYIRTKVFKLEQAPFAGIAGVSQPTVSRWEQTEMENSEPSRKAMELIRSEAIKRGLPWSDSWFFQSFPDEPATSERESAV